MLSQEWISQNISASMARCDVKSISNIAKRLSNSMFIQDLSRRRHWWQYIVPNWKLHIQLTLVISNSMGPWKQFESTVVRLKRSYEDTGSVVCLTTKGRQLERNFEELKPASHVPILGTILNIFDVFVAVFFLSVKLFESCETTNNF